VLDMLRGLDAVPERRQANSPASEPHLHLPNLPRRGFDFDINAGGQTELIERLNRLGCGLNDVDQPLVRADFELLARFFIDRGT
jgi:hypothetical protein